MLQPQYEKTDYIHIPIKMKWKALTWWWTCVFSYVFKDKIGASLEMCERKININYYCWCYFYFACLYSIYNILLNTRKLAPFLIIMLNSWFFVVKRSIYFARSSKHVIITLTILTQPLFGYSDDILLWKPSYMFFYPFFQAFILYTQGN